MVSLDGDSEATEHEFIAVHRQHIVFAVTLGPVEEPWTDGALS